MSKKLLELANEKLSGQLLSDFENFYTFLKSENMIFSQGYKCYRFKYSNVDVGKVGIEDNRVWCKVPFECKGNIDRYVEGQSEEIVDLVMKSLESKCCNCRDGRTDCARDLGTTINVFGKCHKNICVHAFNDSMSFSSVDGSLSNTMRITPRPTSYNDGPYSIDTVKSLILTKKAHIIEIYGW